MSFQKLMSCMGQVYVPHFMPSGIDNAPMTILASPLFTELFEGEDFVDYVPVFMQSALA
jgi:hypothetical protein